MAPNAFRQALKRLGWSYSRAAEELRVTSRQRVGEWARGDREIPPYIERAVELALELEECRKKLKGLE